VAIQHEANVVSIVEGGYHCRPMSLSSHNTSMHGDPNLGLSQSRSIPNVITSHTCVWLIGKKENEWLLHDEKREGYL
jgi:hypothetical protein